MNPKKSNVKGTIFRLCIQSTTIIIKKKSHPYPQIEATSLQQDLYAESINIPEQYVQ